MITPTIGILGAGKLGITLAKILIHAGYTVTLAGSGSPEKIRYVSILAKGSTALDAHDLALQSDIIILALPFSKYATLSKDDLAGKIVIDAMNYWWEVDGRRDALLPPDVSTSVFIQQYLHMSYVVKALSHVGYHDLHDSIFIEHQSVRTAIALAGNDDASVKIVSKIINSAGFDPVPIGALANGIKLEPGRPAFGASVDSRTLRTLIA